MPGCSGKNASAKHGRASFCCGIGGSSKRVGCGGKVNRLYLLKYMDVIQNTLTLQHFGERSGPGNITGTRSL